MRYVHIEVRYTFNGTVSYIPGLTGQYPIFQVWVVQLPDQTQEKTPRLPEATGIQLLCWGYKTWS